MSFEKLKGKVEKFRGKLTTSVGAVKSLNSEKLKEISAAKQEFDKKKSQINKKYKKREDILNGNSEKLESEKSTILMQIIQARVNKDITQEQSNQLEEELIKEIIVEEESEKKSEEEEKNKTSVEHSSERREQVDDNSEENSEKLKFDTPEAIQAPQINVGDND